MFNPARPWTPDPAPSQRESLQTLDNEDLYSVSQSSWHGEADLSSYRSTPWGPCQYKCLASELGLDAVQSSATVMSEQCEMPIIRYLLLLGCRMSI